jgi:hypothetical protein
MGYSELPVLPPRCSNIRWKGMLIDTEPDAVAQGPDHLCWCALTQTCLGPDGQVVDEQDCNAVRSCYLRD